MARDLKLLVDKLWHVISIVGQNTETALNNINSYNVSLESKTVVYKFNDIKMNYSK